MIYNTILSVEDFSLLENHFVSMVSLWKWSRKVLRKQQPIALEINSSLFFFFFFSFISPSLSGKFHSLSLCLLCSPGSSNNSLHCQFLGQLSLNNFAIKVFIYYSSIPPCLIWAVSSMNCFLIDLFCCTFLALPCSSGSLRLLLALV